MLATCSNSDHMQCQVRNNLHMVFTASPVGANFRVRSQRFLATINSTVIDWFQPWPETSLHRQADRLFCNLAAPLVHGS